MGSEMCIRDRHADALDGLALIRRGNRLSVMPVSAEHWDYILGLESADAP